MTSSRQLHAGLRVEVTPLSSRALVNGHHLERLDRQPSRRCQVPQLQRQRFCFAPPQAYVEPNVCDPPVCAGFSAIAGLSSPGASPSVSRGSWLSFSSSCSSHLTSLALPIWDPHSQALRATLVSSPVATLSLSDWWRLVAHRMSDAGHAPPTVGC